MGGKGEGRRFLFKIPRKGSGWDSTTSGASPHKFLLGNGEARNLYVLATNPPDVRTIIPAVFEEQYKTVGMAPWNLNYPRSGGTGSVFI